MKPVSPRPTFKMMWPFWVMLIVFMGALLYITFTIPESEWSPYFFSLYSCFFVAMIGVVAYTYRTQHIKGVTLGEYLLGITEKPEDEREEYLRYKAGFLAFHLLVRVAFVGYLIIITSLTNWSGRVIAMPLLGIMLLGIFSYEILLRRYGIRRSTPPASGNTITFPVTKR